ncbi:MAG: hypothetical protein GKS03_07350 [Alphaproteobacteria bacterium]|nr:hypothetical protein [Alphaproteobacteria bacterium]
MSESPPGIVKTPSSVYLEVRHSFLSHAVFFIVITGSLIGLRLELDMGLKDPAIVVWVIGSLYVFYATYLRGPLLVVSPLGLYVRDSDALYPWSAIEEVKERKQFIQIQVASSFVPGIERPQNWYSKRILGRQFFADPEIRTKSLNYSKDEILQAIRHYKPET